MQEEKTYREVFEQMDSNAIDDLTEIMLNTQEQCQMMDALIKNQINIKDSMINRLHDELDYYKNDAAGRYVDQLMKALVKVHKDMNRIINSDKWADMTVDDLKREYIYTKDDITDLLEQQNVEAYSSISGSLFDPSCQQAKIECTDDLTLDKTVKCSISDGYKKGEKILIPEKVVVYQFKE